MKQDVMNEQLKKATLSDLLQEQWLRKRDAGQIVWITKIGDRIAIKNLSDQHLQNAIDHCIKIDDMIGQSNLEDLIEND